MGRRSCRRPLLDGGGIVLIPESTPDAPNVIAFPPLLFSGALGLGLLAHWLHPLRPLPPVPARILGALLLLGGAALAKWGEIALRRAGTNVNPRQPSTAVVDGGPYRFTRNPLYLGTTLMYLGVAFLVDASAPLVLLPPLLALIQWGVIAREERYLESKFGDDYRAYRARIRRWI